MVDSGSSINIMPLRVLESLALNVKGLTNERIMIHGFDQHGLKAMGAITLDLNIGGLKAPTKLFIIDANTSYKILLGRPWLHENGVVPSTLHQCLKYMHNGKQRRVEGEIRPFGVHEIHLEQAKFFLSDNESEEEDDPETSELKEGEKR